MAKVGRNDLCPCGSGEKYKRCCEPRTTETRTRTLRGLLVGVGLLGALGAAGFVGAMLTGSEEGQLREWSEEHGHWHSVSAPARGEGTPVSAPPGPAPPGKVWSPAHGHWHDIEAGS